MADMDERTEKYLAEEAAKIGYLGTNHSWYEIDEILKKKGVDVVPTKIAEFDGPPGASEIELYEYTVKGATKYCAQLGYQTDIDDYSIETIIFDRKPSQEDITTARLIDDIKCHLVIKDLAPEFVCLDCGIATHWTDIAGKDLFAKHSFWRDRYCGCGC